ncbi:MAG: hypothetical protein JWL83_3853 [Actinomycetia bacterium]|nr:hypothetical protein [Actinomycetes bacterium]
MPKPSWSRYTLVVAVGLVLLPLFVIAARAFGNHSFAPSYDVALIELRVRDIGSHTPLVGSYQRFGFNQPGPMLFYLLVVPYRLLGSRFAGLAFGAVCINAAAIVGIAIIAWRRGGVALLVWSLALVAVLVHALHPAIVSNPWEPDVTVLAFLLLLFLVWDVACGALWSLPFVVLVASFILQAQANFAVIVAVLAALAVALPAWHAFSRRPAEDAPAQRRAFARASVVAGGVGVLLWLPPLVEQFTAPGAGNLHKMWSFLRAPHHVLGFGDAWRTVALQFGTRSWWLGFGAPNKTGLITIDLGRGSLVPVAFLVLLAGTAAAARAKRRDAFLLCVVVLVATVVEVASLSRLVGPLYIWIASPTRTIGLACVLAGGYGLFSALGDPLRARVERTAVPFVAVGALVLVGITTVDAATYDQHNNRDDVGIVRLADLIAPRLSHSAPVLVRSQASVPGFFSDRSFGHGLFVLALEHHGVHTVEDTALANRFGPYRAHPERADTEVVLVTGNGAALAAKGYRRLATIDLLPPRVRAERERVVRALNGYADLEAAVRHDPRAHSLFVSLSHLDEAPIFTAMVRSLTRHH